MAVHNALFLFEVVIENVQSLVPSRRMVIRSDFADVFSLELIDPKEMHIVMPEAPPPPPEPPGKKGKKAKKPKPKKGKKGKKGKNEPEKPPEPIIQSGQSVLITSSAEVLTSTMQKFPMQMSLWSKEDNYSYIGSVYVPWDNAFIEYLKRVYNCGTAPPPTVKDQYNIFEESTAKPMATLGILLKLTYLTDRMALCFRSLTDETAPNKFLYTGCNDRNSSYMCTLKTTDEVFAENSNKVDNGFHKDVKVVMADYKNAPSTKLAIPGGAEFCCNERRDKSPGPASGQTTCPDIDFICDYIQKIVLSCNDYMRMLTPRPTIRPRVKATDIDKLCYCRQENWPKGELAERFKKEVQGPPCPICKDKGKSLEGKIPDTKATLLDIDNIRGPCGRPDCKLARDIKQYIRNIVDEDNTVVNINELVGPCGSKTCLIADKLQDFLRHEGDFAHGGINKHGLNTQCGCIEQLQQALVKKASCISVCEKSCESSDDQCQGKECPFVCKEPKKKEYQVYYFTVEYDKTPPPPQSPSSPRSLSPAKSTSPESQSSQPGSPGRGGTPQSPQEVAPKDTTPTPSGKSSKNVLKKCADDCPVIGTWSDVDVQCSKSTCLTVVNKKKMMEQCTPPVCPSDKSLVPSPEDSKIVINFEKITNPCCVKSCNAAEKVKDFIAEGLERKKSRKLTGGEDKCYCDCDCNFNLVPGKTTYCAICGGYEFFGEDMKELPHFMQPHPCPLYHKLYDKENLKSTREAWPTEEKAVEKTDSKSGKQTKTAVASSKPAAKLAVKPHEKAQTTEVKTKKKKPTKKVGKFTANIEPEANATTDKKDKPHCDMPRYVPVPKNMGWLWNSNDVPGLKYRPQWRPGAINRFFLRQHKLLGRNWGGDVVTRKKKVPQVKKKKSDMKPALTVRKKDGEYTITMEVFKQYSQQRLPVQFPYDDKPPLVYTVGKSDEEKRKLQKAREKRDRNEAKRKNKIIQSTFKDKCQEICLKAYNQAIGVLPIGDPNNPECPCANASEQPEQPTIDSCSCSEDEGSYGTSSDTDNDEWTVFFSPPIAKWDSSGKMPAPKEDAESQYSSWDYRVKLYDRDGNLIPRYFKGPDGKTECSDLGGFWSPNHQWLEINKDGYIGPDGRWVPNNFIGPDGLKYSSDNGTFKDNSGRNYKIGVDGYVDVDGKWKTCPRRTIAAGDHGGKFTKLTSTPVASGKKADPKSSQKNDNGRSKLAVASNTKNAEVKRLGTTQSASKHGIQKKAFAESKKATTVMKVSTYDRKSPQLPLTLPTRQETLYVDPQKMARYREIMQGLKMYDDICELKPPLKTNRASNTPKKRFWEGLEFREGQPRRLPNLVGAVCSQQKGSTSCSSCSNRCGSPLII